MSGGKSSGGRHSNGSMNELRWTSWRGGLSDGAALEPGESWSPSARVQAHAEGSI
jgi:hypothetical protein